MKSIFPPNFVSSTSNFHARGATASSYALVFLCARVGDATGPLVLAIFEHRGKGGENRNRRDTVAMLRKSQHALASTPHVQIAPETTPVKYHPQMLGIQRYLWFNKKRQPYRAIYRERTFEDRWPYRTDDWEKSGRDLLPRQYSPEALREALKMVPPFFETRDVPRPPQRVRAQSEGIVGRWFTNYWTLHSVRYQCMLASVPWEFGDRQRPLTNFDEPFLFVDFEESKAIRDYRSRWINVNRSLANMSKRMKEVEEETRFLAHKRTQEAYWSNRKVLINRVRAMVSQGTLEDARDLPVATMDVSKFQEAQ